MALKTTVHDIVKDEMEEDLEESCQKIKDSRSSKTDNPVSGKDATVQAAPQQTG